jgi:GT2 family glycosyltransferase
VDNASNDGSAEAISTSAPDVTLVETTSNLGFAGGMNLGVDKAKSLGATRIWFLNNDTVVDRSCLLHQLASVSTTTVAVPTILNIETHKVWYGGGHVDAWRGLVIQERWGESAPESCVTATGYATGCSMLVPTSTGDAIGWFDERFFLYWEDVEFSLRLVAGGFPILYVSAAIVYHAASSSSASEEGAAPALWYYGARSRLWYVRVCQHGIQRLSALAYTPVDALRNLRLIVKRPGSGKMADLKALLSGLWSGAFATIPGARLRVSPGRVRA